MNTEKQTEKQEKNLDISISKYNICFLNLLRTIEWRNS